MEEKFKSGKSRWALQCPLTRASVSAQLNSRKCRVLCMHVTDAGAVLVRWFFSKLRF